jgi:hypothetical protein
MSQAQPKAASPSPLTPVERQALRRVAAARGDLVPVHRVHATRLADLRLVRVVPPTKRDRLTLGTGETWAVATDHGRAFDAMLRARS